MKTLKSHKDNKSIATIVETLMHCLASKLFLLDFFFLIFYFYIRILFLLDLKFVIYTINCYNAP